MADSFCYGAKNGSSIIPGAAATTLITKNAGQPIISASEPEGAARTSRPKAIKLDNNAYWVAENLGLHKLMMKPTKAAVASP